MLVLSRRKGESIIIQDEIEITILGVDGDNVRLGIKAPRNVEVFRSEVYLSIQEANLESAQQSSVDIGELLKHYKNSK
jgi:carbon storage regulator